MTPKDIWVKKDQLYYFPVQMHRGGHAVVLASRDPAVPRLHGRSHLRACGGKFQALRWHWLLLSV